MTEHSATEFFRTAAGIPEGAPKGLATSEQTWGHYRAEHAAFKDTDQRQYPSTKAAQQHADEICDKEGLPRVKVRAHRSPNPNYSRYDSQLYVKPERQYMPVVSLGKSSYNEGVLIHELAHHKHFTTTFPDGKVDPEGREKYFADDEGGHGAGFQQHYHQMISDHHSGGSDFADSVRSHAAEGGFWKASALQAEPTGEEGPLNESLVCLSPTASRETSEPHTATAFFRGAYDAPEGGGHGSGRADRRDDVSRGRGGDPAPAGDRRRPQPGQHERAEAAPRRVHASAEVERHPELQGDLDRLGGGARHVQDTITALQHGHSSVSTYPLSHPLEGWHAAITSGGHQVVHRVDPDTKTLHVGYAGHNIADAEERLGASGGEGSSLPVEFHKGAEKDFDSLHPEVQEKALNTIDRLARGEQHKFDHALTGKHWETGGWRSARADFLHRVTHRFEDNEGNPVSAPERAARLFIGHIGPHNYEAAQKRLSSLTAWFRTASLPQEWYHGSGAAFDRFDMSKNKTVQDDDDAKHWNSHLGAHFTSDHRVAQEFAQRQGGGHVYHARLDLQNPKHYESEHDLDREAAHWAHANGHDLGPTMSNPAYREQTEPDEWQFLIKYNDEGHPRPEAREIAHGFRKHLQAQGHDGITYGNEFEGAHNGFHAGERHLSAIAFHPDQIQITQRHGGAEDHEPRTAATRGVDNEGHPVELDDIDGWHHADGSVSHDDGTTISDHPVRVTEAEERLMQRQAAAVTYDDGIMVAFVPPPEIAAQLAQDGGQTADDLHITLAYLGHVADYTPEQLSLLPQLVSAWAMRQKPVTIRIGGVGTFNNAYKNQHVLWAHPDIPGGVQMHVSLVRELERYKFRLPSEHGWTPHMTLQYVNQHHRFMPQLPQIGWEATEVVTFIGTARHAARLGSRPSTTTTL